MRDERIDFLRALGLLMIILAHVNPPDLVFQLRNFDVPLMVIVAGLSFQRSFKMEPYRLYFFGRVKRLVIPVWIFLSFFFLINFFGDFPKSLPEPKVILSSYLLLNGIGYVWIIRVFLLVALIAPFVHAYSESQSSNRAYIVFFVVIYAIYEGGLFFFGVRGGVIWFLLENTLLCMIPYAVVFAVGVRLARFSLHELIFATVLFFFVFLFFAIRFFEQSGSFLPMTCPLKPYQSVGERSKGLQVN